jgi:plastocyanin
MRLLFFALIISAAAVCEPAVQQGIDVTGQIAFSGAANRKTDSANAVVWLRRPDGVQPRSSRRQTQLRQKRKTFSPHVLVVEAGTSVDFPNDDPFFHNVFSLFEGKRFDLGLYESGSSRTVVFNRPGISYIFCNIHPEMSAVVIALDTPYFGISDSNGNITIGGVPPGSYQLQVWDERVLPDTLNRLSRPIAISPSARSFGVIQLPEQRNLSRTHKNKYGQDYPPAPRSSPVYTKPKER